MRRRRNSGEPPRGGRAVARFAVSGFAALVLVSVGLSMLLRRSTSDIAIDDAKGITRLVATGIVQPELDDAMLRGDTATLAKLDRLVRTRVLGESIVRVKVWTAAGKIVYSDEPRLIGRTFPLSTEQTTSLRTGAAAAGLSDLEEPENSFERGHGSLLEVYLPVRTPSGNRLLIETYQRADSIAAGGRRLWIAVLPLTVGALALLEFVQLPVAWSMTRRLRESQAEREELFNRTLDASNAERRRIAGDLHDGIVQELAGIAYALSAAGEALGPEASPELRTTIGEAARRTRQGIRGLRAMMVEIYPPNLRDAGLAAAVHDLAGPLAARGIEATVHVDDARLDDDTEALLFRVTQEALRNVVAHAGASAVSIALDVGPKTATLEIRDDGAGFAVGRPATAIEEGHVGLRVMRDALADAGGTLEVISAPREGTTVRASVPLRGGSGGSGGTT